MKRYSHPLVHGAAIPNWWKPLFQSSCNASIFLSEAWLQTWLDIYGHGFQGYWVYWKDSEVVGGCLLLTRTVKKHLVPLRSLYLNATGESPEGTPLAEFNDVLHIAGYAEAIAADLARLVDDLPWDRLLLSGYQENGLPERLVALLPAALVESNSSPAPYVDLSAPTEEPVEAALSANTRSQIRRSRRLYEEKLGPISLALAASEAEAISYLEELARLHNARWASKGKPGAFESRPFVDFHRQFISCAWSSQAINLLRVSAGESVVGYLYNFIHQGKVYFFQSGFTYEADSKFKPGLLVHSLAIEHYKQAGALEYDFLAGDAQYKRSLAKQQRRLCWSTVYRDKAWIRIALWARQVTTSLAAQDVAPAARSGIFPEPRFSLDHERP